MPSVGIQWGVAWSPLPSARPPKTRLGSTPRPGLFLAWLESITINNHTPYNTVFRPSLPEKTPSVHFHRSSAILSRSWQSCHQTACLPRLELSSLCPLTSLASPHIVATRASLSILYLHSRTCPGHGNEQRGARSSDCWILRAGLFC